MNRTYVRALKRRLFASLTYALEVRIVRSMFMRYRLGGSTIDLGGGSSPYKKLLKHGSIYNTIDLNKASPETIVGDIHSLPLHSDTTDLVIATNIFEHAEDPSKCIFEAARVLRSGGYLICITPFLFKVHPNPMDYWRFTYQGLDKMFKDKFEIVESYPVGNRFYVVWELFTQTGILQVLRLVNPLIASFQVSNKDYALSYVYLLRKI